MRTFTFTRPGGSLDKVDAEYVDFTPHHVLFTRNRYAANDTACAGTPVVEIVLAVQADEVHDLVEVAR